ncbi:MAG: 3-dehydroquinate synthase [Bacteroides sp.]|nr:3-dehydroquinate synthase [Bacteroides sp.]MCM1413058.1 3-dehydroquinate synthase [Bacteroides sp.]MCM1471764.1 3-dehydroquinate synthase [Bacteroides sp.]
MAESDNIIFTSDPGRELTALMEGMQPTSIFVLADDNTAQLAARPLMERTPLLKDAWLITIKHGDDNKSLESLAAIWERLSTEGATRHSLLINIGGGMVTDIGGMAAATFKRGCRCINVPTTLLAAVDASVGGKTGINFAGLKNEIGCFSRPAAVVISTGFFKTLPHVELLSGYAELLKHALLESDRSLVEALNFDLEKPDYDRLQQLVEQSVRVKERIVTVDPTEKGLRKALNLGHTTAHALESLAMSRGATLPHGLAVATGLVVALVLSSMRFGFPSATVQNVASYIKEYYPATAIACSDYDRLIGYMRHDKKNRSADHISMTLLRAPGDPVIDCVTDEADIRTALDIARDLLGL